jgi:predicted Zn-dependent peptidase
MLDLVMAEFSKLKEALLTAEELHRAKEQVKGNILLGLESSGSRMSNLARQEMYFKHFFSVEEVLERLDAVTAEQVQVMAQKLFVSERIAVTLLGRLDGLKLSRSRLVC